MIAGRGEANSRTHSRAALGAALSLALLALALGAPGAGAVVLKVHGRGVGVTPRRGIHTGGGLPGARPAPGAPGSSATRGFDELPNGGSPLTWHGGPVMHSAGTHVIYWDPKAQFTTTTKGIVNSFFSDVELESGVAGNVFAIAGQYTDGSGNAAYSSTYSGALVDTNGYPKTGNCTIPKEVDLGPYEACLTDAQLQAQLKTFIEAEKLPRGPSQLYFILSPHKIVTCLEAGVCSNNFYCAYHSYIEPGTANEIIYADIPFSLLDSEWVKGCQADGNGEIQLPNGDATLTNSTRYADVALKYISHEYTEAVTDPLVGFDTAWVDREELENGDKCNAVPFSSAEEGAPGVDKNAFKPTLGGSSSAGTLYNQEIDAGHFYLQSEWDNAAKACLMKPLALKSAQFTHSPATPAAGTPVSFSASVTDPYGHPVYSWSFGDGGAAGSGAAPTHTYEAGGKYTVKLTIEDARTNSKATVEAELVIAGPLVVTGTATSLTQGSATLRGTVNPLGKAVSKCEFEYGTSVPYGAKAPCASLPPTSEEPQPVSASLSTLSANTTYHFRLVAVTEAGTSKSADQTFKTLPEPPVVVTGATPSPLGQESATLNGTVNPKGVAVSKCEFEYGEAGQVAQHRVPCSALPGAAETPVAVSGAISALTPGTEYELRLVAETSGGKVTAEPHAFQTLPKLSPLVLASKPSPVGQSSATLLGSVDPRGGAVLECRFDYGASAAYGSSAPCSPAPGGGTGAVAVAGALSGLAPGGTYHFRLVATNSGGTAETGDQTFTTASAAPPLLAPTFPSQILGSFPPPPTASSALSTASSALSTASSAFSLSGPVINASTGVATFTLSVVNGGTASWLLTFQNGKFGVFAASAHKCKAGSAWLGGRCRPAKVVFAKAGRTVVAAGSVTITIKPGAAALKALKNALRKKKGLTVSAQITFRSSLGAAAVAHSVTFTDRLKKR